MLLFKAIVRGSQAYGAAIWAPLVRASEFDRTFFLFLQHFFHLHGKTSRMNVYLLSNTVPFSIWMRKLAVSYLLRAVAAPCDTLVHQCLVQLVISHNAGFHN